MLARQQGITPPHVPPGRRVYAIGDVHGRYDLLTTLLSMIEADAEGDARDENVLVFLGDYVDRGPDSKRVVERLTMPPPPGFDIVCLKGNHEEIMLQFLDGEGDAILWLRNGGRETLRSYGIDTSDLYASPIPDQAIEQVRRQLRSLIPGSHVEFLSSLDLMHPEGDYLFVHAGVRPGVELADQREEDLVWIRNDFLKSSEDFGKIIVHGHSITYQPTITANRIGIDTGAWRSDVLTCLVLDGEERRFLST